MKEFLHGVYEDEVIALYMRIVHLSFAERSVQIIHRVLDPPNSCATKATIDLLVEVKYIFRAKLFPGEIVVWDELSSSLTFWKAICSSSPHLKETSFFKSFWNGSRSSASLEWICKDNKPSPWSFSIIWRFWEVSYLEWPYRWLDPSLFIFDELRTPRFTSGNTKRTLQRIHSQVILFASYENLPQIINMLNDLSGLYDNIINIIFSTIMEHIIKMTAIARC